MSCRRFLSTGFSIVPPKGLSCLSNRHSGLSHYPRLGYVHAMDAAVITALASVRPLFWVNPARRSSADVRDSLAVALAARILWARGGPRRPEADVAALPAGGVAA
jgi:hypothetical protein